MTATAVRRLSPAELSGVLLGFELAWWAEHGWDEHGEMLSSSAFYERYRAGEFDSLLTMMWASYYEATRHEAVAARNGERTT